jgi:N12 class adenine-specific DNA methylase
MPSKVQAYAQMADHAATQITGSRQSWTEFLSTAARLYKYPYHEQLMIYAQRPDATACAEYDLWNNQMHRYVRRGSKGIALIDASGDKPRLRYVFDVSDTGGGVNSRRPFLWELNAEHEAPVTAMLERNYDIPANDGLAEQLQRIAAQMADEYWMDNQYDILRIVDDSFLEEYDDFNVGMAFREAATVSISYLLMKRCGIDPDDYFEHEDFLSVFDFNTPSTVAALGTATSEISQRVLRQIEVTIKNYERERSYDNERNDVQPERGLSDTRHDDERAEPADRQIREDAEELPEGAAPHTLEQPPVEREAVSAPVGDRADGTAASRTVDEGAAGGAERERELEGQRPDEVGGADEQLQGTSRGNDTRGADLQLKPQPEQLSLFPSETEQIAMIAEAESEQPSASSLSDVPESIQVHSAVPQQVTQADIDDALRSWNGDADSKRAVASYMSDHARDKETAAWLSRKYSGSETPSLYVVSGNSEPVELSWQKVQRRIAQLIQKDQFLTAEERAYFADADHEAEARVDAMLETAERIAAESEVEPYERFSVIETDDGYAIWDDIHDDYYVDEVGVSERFTSEWQAETYLDEVRSSVAERESAEWQYIEEAKLGQTEQRPEVSRVNAFSPFSMGDTVYLENGKPFIVESITDMHITLRDPTLFYPILRAESLESFAHLMQQFPQPERGTKPQQEMSAETVAVYPAEENNLPYDIVIQTLHTEPEHPSPSSEHQPVNFRIADDELGVGGPKVKFRANIEAIRTLQTIEAEGRTATPDEQRILSKYVGWGGLAQAFDKDNGSWASEYVELKGLLSEDEYVSARASTLNAHFTSPTVIRGIYEAIANMGFTSGNILEPSMGIGNFFGMLPESMAASRLYGVELDSLTGRIARQLYPQADITISGFEKTDRRDFFDLAVGNVPFGQYKVSDKAYDKLGFSIHDYFFAKTIDQVRAGGVIAFVTSKFTLDKQSPEVRKYLAQRAEFLGAIRLPNNAFRANAGTDVVSDIIFFQKRDRPVEIDADWIHLGTTPDGYTINSYFVEHPDMVLGQLTSESTQYGHDECTVIPIEGADLATQLSAAVQNISGQYTEAELPDLGDGEEIDTSIPADPNVKNFSYTVVDGEVYYRENSRMVKPELNQTAVERVKGLVELRDCVHALMDYQLNDYVDTVIREQQRELNRLYDAFTAKYGLINSRGNSLAFSDDSAYYLLCSLELLDENGELDRKADMFTKRTIRSQRVVTSVDTASEALALSISEKAKVDMDYMSQLTGKDEEAIASELYGVIFRVPELLGSDARPRYVTADEYLSGNVREKLRIAERAARADEQYQPNVEALLAAQPKDLDASEIDVRLGATWVGRDYVEQFMYELLDTPRYLQGSIEVKYSPYTAEWNITGKNQISYNNVAAYVTYGTDRANAYRIMEDTLNLRDVRIFDTVTDPDGKERRVLNKEATTLAQQKQQAIKDAFRDWVWKDPDRRQALVQQYNTQFNSIRPREYDGQHITFSGINPEITLREHQLNAVAHIMYGGNTLLAHEVGAGKTFEMVAAAMESKRLGLCQKSLFVVPNHLTEQWASEFLRLYPSANILVATKKDFEKRNRKKFCARIATGDYDAVIIGHSQFERIPISQERQERLLQEQIDEITDGIAEVKASGGERFTIKEPERTKKSLEAKLDKLLTGERKDDVVTFEQLGVDRLYVDEAHSFKNLFLYTKMRNVAGLSTTDAQKSSDMFLKCRYIDEVTDGKGIIFATGTPVSNSMTELYTMQRYLQYFALQRNSLNHFDCWASTFGETQTAIELAPEGTGYRARTRFAKFFNLPELMTLFKEAADIKTSDQLHLPTPEAHYHTVVVEPTEIQKEMVQDLSERAAAVHANIVDPSVDNMLKITSDGRKLGLDQRIINPLLPDDPQSKVNACIGNIYRIWDEGQDKRLTQLVFCDISTPSGRTTAGDKAAKAGEQTINGVELRALDDMMPVEAEPEAPHFNVYSDIRQKLIAKGIPSEQIAFIHEANTEVRKKELFAKVRNGQVRVLIGSTAKMGAGTNVQDRLVAMHDLDCPWRPGDLEQRSGRIVRQGNSNLEVDIYRYVTDGTFDAYLWQTVENKQKFISQIMTSKSPVRSCEDVDETALSYAEIKALCAGNPLIKEKMDLDIDVARLKLLKADHNSKQYRLEDNLLKYFPENIERNKGFISGFKQDMETLENHPHPKDGFAGMVVRGDTLTDKDNAGAAILEACKEVKGREPVEIGSYRGFTMSLSFDSFEKEYKLSLKGAMTHTAVLGSDARGNLIRIDNALATMPERLKAAESQLENLYQQMEAAKLEIGKPFPQEAELQQKSARLAMLDAELNMDGGQRPALGQQRLAKQERPSVLECLKAPCKSGTIAKKPKQEREVR